MDIETKYMDVGSTFYLCVDPDEDEQKWDSPTGLGML
jgi:hypothetical protein